MSAPSFDRPLVVDSGDDNGRTHGEIYRELGGSFAPLAARLISPGEWCCPHTAHQLKACTQEHTPEGDFLIVYSGHEFYEPIERTHSICYATGSGKAGFTIVGRRNDGQP